MARDGKGLAGGEGEEALLLKRISRRFLGLTECVSQLRGWDAGKRCPNRGQIGPDGEVVREALVPEIVDAKCVLLGRKPLALLHRLDTETKELTRACGCGVMSDKSKRKSGTALVYLPENKALAEAAAPALRAIGAWGLNPDLPPEPHIEDGCQFGGLTEEQGHLVMGYLLGYPEPDIRGMHSTLCALREQPAMIAQTRVCDFAADSAEAKHYIDKMLGRGAGANSAKKAEDVAG